jgi:hypothetical protein
VVTVEEGEAGAEGVVAVLPLRDELLGGVMDEPVVQLRRFARARLGSVSVVGLGLLVGRMVVVVVVVVPLLVGAAAVVALGSVSGDVADDELGAVALDAAVVARAVPVIVPVGGLVEGLLAPQGRVVAPGDLLPGRRLVEVLPGLTVVTVQATSTPGRAAVEASHGVAVGGGSVPVMLTTPAAIPGAREAVSIRAR